MIAIQPIYRVAGAFAVVTALLLAGYFFRPAGKSLNAGEPASDEPETLESVWLITAYLDPPLGDARRVCLMGTPGRRCTLVIDTQENKPDFFGDVSSRPTQEPIDAELVPVADPTIEPGERRRLYEVKGYEKPRLRLASPTATIPTYRLLEIDAAGHPLRVVSMEPWVLPRAIPSATGSNPAPPPTGSKP